MAAMPRSWGCWLETEPAAANLRRVVPFWQSSRFADILTMSQRSSCAFYARHVNELRA